MLHAVAFDWGRTLFDNDRGALFPDARVILQALSRRYRLALVSLVTDGDLERRCNLIRTMGVERVFQTIHLGATDKDQLYEEMLAALRLSPQEVAIVDDRVIRGVRWGNRRGALTIWFRNGKFANELPTDDTGAPAHTVSRLSELRHILLDAPGDHLSGLATPPHSPRG